MGKQEFLTLFVLLDSLWDVFLGSVGQHHAVGHIGIVDVKSRMRRTGSGSFSMNLAKAWIGVGVPAPRD